MGAARGDGGGRHRCQVPSHASLLTPRVPAAQLDSAGDTGRRHPPPTQPPGPPEHKHNCLPLTSASKSKFSGTSCRIKALCASVLPVFPGREHTYLWGQSMKFAGCCGRYRKLCHRNPELPPSPRAAAAPSSPSAYCRSPTAWCRDVDRAGALCPAFCPPEKQNEKSLLTALQLTRLRPAREPNTKLSTGAVG